MLEQWQMFWTRPRHLYTTEICSVSKDQKTTDLSSTTKDKGDRKVAISKERNRKMAAQGQKRERPVDKVWFEYNTDLCTILMDVGSRMEIDRPFPMKSPVESRDSKLFCQFHGDIGHEQKDCRNSRRALDGLAAEGFLKQNHQGGIGDYNRDRKKSLTLVYEDEGTFSNGGFVAVISGGLVSGGPTNSRT